MRGKYRKRYMRKLRRKSKKSIIRDIDHSGKGLQFARAIAKGISRKAYDTCVSVQTNHVVPDGWVLTGNPPQIDATYMTPFGRVFELQSSLSADQSNFCPFSCMNGFGAREHEFNRHANMYTQFRVKAIRFEFVPTTAVTGRESILPCTAGVPSSTTLDDVLQAMDSNQSISSTYWIVKWPYKSTGMFQDFGMNLHSTSPYPRVDSALVDPSCIKIPITEKLVLTWKPKIMGYKTKSWVPLNTSSGFGSDNVKQSFEPTAKKFPWLNILANYHPSSGQQAVKYVPDVEIPSVTVGVSTNEYNTENLRVSMTQPLLACYDSLTNQFLAPARWPITGRWTMHTVFEFRCKRSLAAGQLSNTINENTANIEYAGDAGASVDFDRA